MNNRPKSSVLYVISGPSGVGKSTLCNYLLNKLPNLKFSVSTTTRPIRKGEIDGKDYLFTDKKTFKQLIDKNEFLEWAIVHDNYYGTQKQMVSDFTSEGFDIILEVDVQGGISIKKSDPDAVLIFIAPPDFSDLEKRLKNRGTDTIEVINKRLNNAKAEMEKLKAYDYLVINDSLEESKEILKSIFIAEKNKTFRKI